MLSDINKSSDTTFTCNFWIYLLIYAVLCSPITIKLKKSFGSGNFFYSLHPNVKSKIFEIFWVLIGIFSHKQRADKIWSWHTTFAVYILFTPCFTLSSSNLCWPFYLLTSTLVNFKQLNNSKLTLKYNQF